MGREYTKIVCKTEEEAKELLEAYKTITRIKGFPIYKGYTEKNIVYLEIRD